MNFPCVWKHNPWYSEFTVQLYLHILLLILPRASCGCRTPRVQNVTAILRLAWENQGLARACWAAQPGHGRPLLPPCTIPTQVETSQQRQAGCSLLCETYNSTSAMCGQRQIRGVDAARLNRISGPLSELARPERRAEPELASPPSAHILLLQLGFRLRVGDML